MMMDHTRPDQDTIDAEDDEADSEHGADREPTPAEAQAAEQNEVDPEVARQVTEAGERGAKVEGEGSVP